MKRWVLALMITTPVYGQDMVLDQIPTKMSDPMTQNDEIKDDKMRDQDNQEINIQEHMKSEQERIKQIRLLSLDVEKASLLLKHQELLDQINQKEEQGLMSHINQEVIAEEVKIQLIGIMKIGNQANALIVYDQKEYLVKQGDQINEYVVTDIKEDEIILTDQLGMVKSIRNIKS